MILITGATSGIGEATARHFGQSGHDLILIGRREERLQSLGSKLANFHNSTGRKIEVHTFQLDMRDGQAVRSWTEQHHELLRHTRVLVNNAGLALGVKPVQESDYNDWDAMIDTNVKGLLAMSREILPLMLEKKKEARDGHIVNVGSVAGHYAYPGGNVYCATKAAVRMLSECMRMDLLGTGIRVTDISPGMVETEFSEVRFRGDKARADQVYRGMSPLTPDDIAETIAWCVGRPRHVNVQELVIYPTDQASPTLVHRES